MGVYAYRHSRLPESSWSRESRRVILRVIDEHRGKDAAVVRDAIDAAYPFGPRSMHPYKQWLKERKAAFRALETPDQFCADCAAELPPWASVRCTDCDHKRSLIAMVKMIGDPS